MATESVATRPDDMTIARALHRTYSARDPEFNLSLSEVMDIVVAERLAGEQRRAARKEAKP